MTLILEVPLPDAINQLERQPRIPARAFYLLLVFIVALLTSAWAIGDWLILSPDSFRYLRGARSLAEDGTFGVGRLSLPPGFSCLLYLVMTPDGLPLAEARVLLIVGWMATAILTHIYYRKHRHARIVALLVAVSPALLIQSDYLLSELTFMPFALGTLIQFEAWREGRLAWWRILLGVFCCTGAILIRTMGIVLLPLGLLALARRRPPATEAPARDANSGPIDTDRERDGRQPQTLARVIAGTLLVIATIYPQLQWSARERGYQEEYGYSQILFQARFGESADDDFVTLQVKRFIEFAPLRLAAIKEAVVPTRLGWRLFQSPLATPSTWLIGGGLLILLGWRAWRYRMLIDYFALLTLGLLSIWPWDEGVRFVLPLLPALWAALLGGLDALTGFLGDAATKRRRLAFAGVIILMIAVLAYENRLIIDGRSSRAEKATARLAEMQALGKQAAPYFEGALRIGCVLNNESLDKTTIIGAMYLQRQCLWPVIDVKPNQAIDWQGLNGAVFFVSPDILAADPPANYRVLTGLLDNRLQLIAGPPHTND